MIKKVILILAATALSSSAATVNYSTTTTGNRVVIATNPTIVPVPALSLVRMGSLASENDFGTFVEFGTSTVNPNVPFPSGGVISGGATNNTAEAATFAGKTIYIAIYNAATAGAATFAGVFKSTSIFDAGITGSAAQTFTLPVASFTTAVNTLSPASWAFNPASVNVNGTTGAAGTPPTNRTGVVFTLGAIVPEPSSVALLALVGLAIGRRRR